MSKSNFQKVIEFTKTAGQPVHGSPTMPSPQLAALRLNLITEELQELYDAVLANTELSKKIQELFDTIRALTQDVKYSDQVKLDTQETPDALGDILYVVYGAAATFGFDIDDYFADIHESNMSKFDTCVKDAFFTRLSYSTGSHPDKPGQKISGLETRAVKTDDGRELHVIYSEATGKILKSSKYTPVHVLREQKGKVIRKAYFD